MTTACTPASWAANATPWAWFPAESVMTPAFRSAAESACILLRAPRILNAPGFVESFERDDVVGHAAKYGGRGPTGDLGGDATCGPRPASDMSERQSEGAAWSESSSREPERAIAMPSEPRRGR